MICNHFLLPEAVSIGNLLPLNSSAVANLVSPRGMEEQANDPLSSIDPGAPVRDEARPMALIVDDVADVSEMLSVFLSLAGYEVVTALSASEALEAARSTHFDVVISDIGMPQMNGYELAQALRSTPGYEGVPLVAVTGFSLYDDLQRSLQSGFNAHLTKPVDPNELFQLIERLRD